MRPEWGAAAAGVVLFFWVAFRLFPNIDQDAWIYFTYYKQFFDRPFSFQPGHVAFGATSPLHVVLTAPIYHVFGPSWLNLAKLVNFCLVLAGVVLVHRASRAHLRLMPLLIVACLCFETLMQATATLFETGIVFFLVSLMLHSFERERTRATIATAALLHLARPELILVTATAFAAVAVRHRRLFLRHWALSLFPVAAYYIYMWASGAGIVPTSVVGRAILGVEFPTTWAQKIAAILGDPQMHVYGLGLAVSLVTLVTMPRRAGIAMIVIVPIIALYTAVPPGWAYFTARYLVPVIPGLLYCLALLLDRLHRAALFRTGLHESGQLKAALAVGVAAAAVLIVARYAPHEPRFLAYTHDMILQKDLANAVSGIVRPDDRVLMYEIQGQYYFPGHGISADGIVGREAHDFLLKRQTFDEFVARENLRFIVTFNAFSYRRIYAGTPLVDIYSHDLTAKIGDEMCVGRYCYQKVAGNPHFNDSYVELPAAGVNVGNTMRYYSGASDPRLKNQLIQWNSVYRIRPARLWGRPPVAWARQTPLMLATLRRLAWPRRWDWRRRSA